MDKNEILDYVDNIEHHLLDGVLVLVFRNIEKLNSELKEWWATDRLETIRTIYQPMLQYQMTTEDDPEHDKIYTKIIIDLWVLTDDIKEALLTRIDYTYEYVMKRGEMLNAKQLPELQQRLLGYDMVIENSQRVQYERDCERLFTYFWLCDRLNGEQEAVLLHLLEDEKYSIDLKALLVSALTLNLLRYFDITKLTLLLRLAVAHETVLKSRAMVGLLCALQAYNKRIKLYANFNTELNLALEDVVFHRDFRTAFTQIVRTNETLELTRHIREDLMPEMMKMAPQMVEKIKNRQKDVSDEEEMNPDWNPDDAEFTKTMEEFARLQREGSDVYYSSFSHMRHVPFFMNFSNWFLPFNPLHSSLQSMQEEGKSVLEILSNNPFMCDSDKYALTSSFMQMPLIQRNMITENLGAEREEMQEMLQNSKQNIKQSPLIMQGNQYVQDLFRFYELNSNSKGFNNAFTNMNELLRFEEYSYFDHPNDKLELSEFLFHKKWYKQAFNLFAQLSSKELNAGIYQKMAFCKLQRKQYVEALEWLDKAELLESNHLWTKRRQALCYAKLGKYNQAIAIYALLLEDDGDNIGLNTKYAALLVDNKQYTEALKVYFKIDYLKPSVKNKRQIAWVSFIAAQYDQSILYYNKLIASDDMEAVDYLNYGHTLCAIDKINEGIKAYKTSNKELGNLEVFVQLFLDDMEYLNNIGMDTKHAIMLLDAVLILD